MINCLPALLIAFWMKPGPRPFLEAMRAKPAVPFLFPTAMRILAILTRPKLPSIRLSCRCSSKTLSKLSKCPSKLSEIGGPKCLPWGLDPVQPLSRGVWKPSPLPLLSPDLLWASWMLSRYFLRTKKWFFFRKIRKYGKKQLTRSLLLRWKWLWYLFLVAPLTHEW